jgi:hypothetical protein
MTADGNRKADHVLQKTGNRDAWISEGSGMIPKREDYHAFLKTAIERLTVSAIFVFDMISLMFCLKFTKKAPCQNRFQAIMNALLSSKACDVTGIVAIACARHGCYVPNTIVDLSLGEGQKNVDYGILKVIERMDPDQGLMILYDIACQYIVHFHDRIGKHLPEGLDVEAAIGLFHVHGHKDQCFFRFASSFIPGAGIVAGEILESLWSSLNSISPSARTATLAHRAEILDDHATDSNHKKMLGIVKAISKNYFKSFDMSASANEYYDKLTNQAGPISVAKWEHDINEAEKSRNVNLPAMDLYAAKLKQAVIPQSATSNEGSTALDRWMSFALIFEDKQYVIKHIFIIVFVYIF